MTRIVVTLQEYLCTFIPVSFSVIILIRNVSGKRCRENQNTNFMFRNFFWKSCRLWDNVEKCDRL